MKKLAIALMAITISSPVLAANNLPFVGTRHFNFYGGNGTGGSITITRQGQVTVKSIGTISTGIDYRGRYQNPIPLKYDDGSRYYYKIVGNTIQMLDENKKLEYDEACNNSFADNPYYTEEDIAVPCISKLTDSL